MFFKPAVQKNNNNKNIVVTQTIMGVVASCIKWGVQFEINLYFLMAKSCNESDAKMQKLE